MVRINFFLDRNHKKKLEAISDKTGAPVGALIRKAIEAYLKKK